LRNQGRDSSKEWFAHEEIGYNYRISEINCALGIAQLARIAEILKARERVAERYETRLRNHGDLILPPMEIAQGKISWFVYVVRLKERFAGAGRDRIAAELTARGIGCGRYFAPIHQQPAYRNVPHRCMDLQVTESIAERTLALPFFNQLEETQVDEVCRVLREVMSDT
jgi:perosamine synthetase